MASKQINISWIITGSKPKWKIMYYHIVVYPVFYKYKNVRTIILKPVLLSRAFEISGQTKLMFKYVQKGGSWRGEVNGW